MNQKNMAKNSKDLRPLRLGFDVTFLVAVLTLLAFGLLMVYSASWQPSLLATGSRTTAYFFLNQLRWAGVGLVAATIASFFDYRRLRRFVVPIMGVTLLLLIAVLIFGDDRFNSRRSLFNGSIQPSELAKFVIIIYLAYWLYMKQEKINDVMYGLFPMGMILAIIAGLILWQPDISAALTVVAIGGILFFMADVDFRQILLVIVIVAILAFGTVMIFETGQTRITDYWNGLQDPINSSFHIRRSVEAIVRGGLFGVGIGNGTTKFTGLPVSHTDSIFAVIAEETGVIGSAVVVGLFLVFLWRGLVIAGRAPDKFGRLLASGLTIWIVLEAVINMGVMVNLLPFAGNALPLMSAGGSSLVTTLVSIGVIMNVARIGALEKETKEGRTFGAVVDLRGRNRRRSVSRPNRFANTRR